MEQKQNAQAKQQLLNVLQSNTVNETTLLLSAAYLQRSITQVINLLSQKDNIQHS